MNVYKKRIFVSVGIWWLVCFVIILPIAKVVADSNPLLYLKLGAWIFHGDNMRKRQCVS